jgi:hypothetical protein
MKAVKIISSSLVKEIDFENKLDMLELTVENAIKNRENADRRSEIALEKLHNKIDKDIKLSLKRVETKVEKLCEIEKPKEKCSFFRCFICK